MGNHPRALLSDLQYAYNAESPQLTTPWFTYNRRTSLGGLSKYAQARGPKLIIKWIYTCETVARRMLTLEEPL